MKAEGLTFLPVAIFFTIMTPVYYFLGRYQVIHPDGSVTHHVEWAGVAALALSALMTYMIVGYTLVWAKRNKPRPEDIKTAEIADGAGDIGFFPPSSIWPFFCAIVAGLLILGPALGWWLSLLGVGMGIWALSGWIFQYYRGEYAH